MAMDTVEFLVQTIEALGRQQSALKETIRKQKRRLQSQNPHIVADANGKIAEALRALQDVVERHRARELELTFERATRSLQDAYRALREGQERAVEAASDVALTDRTIAMQIEALENIRATVRLLAKRDDEITDIIRKFVQARPRGWMHSDDPLKRYLAWFAESGLLLVFLKDNPRYHVSVKHFLERVGKERAEAFLHVSHSALAKAVDGGLIQDAKGDALTMEQLRDLRRRTVAAPSVEIRRRGEEQPIEELLDLIDPQYAEGDGDDISVLALDTATEKALRIAETHRVGQLRRSGDELTNIAGIGEKRASAIHDALTRRTKAA